MEDDKNKNEAFDPNAPLVQGIDFYIENGFFVFTESYLRRRGYCCGNGCRHCPYEVGEVEVDSSKSED